MENNDFEKCPQCGSKAHHNTYHSQYFTKYFYRCGSALAINHGVQDFEPTQQCDEIAALKAENTRLTAELQRLTTK